jgi:hypothetical protein
MQELQQQVQYIQQPVRVQQVQTERAGYGGGGGGGTNESLARLRAASVAAYLSQDNLCGTGVGSMISLNGAPLLATPALPKEANLSADRQVVVYGLVPRSHRP